jgi:hypothetical protein
MKELHRQLLPRLLANNTRVLRGPHLTGLIEDWLTGKRSAAPTAAVPPEEKRAA